MIDPVKFQKWFLIRPSGKLRTGRLGPTCGWVQVLEVDVPRVLIPGHPLSIIEEEILCCEFTRNTSQIPHFRHLTTPQVIHHGGCGAADLGCGAADLGYGTADPHTRTRPGRSFHSTNQRSYASSIFGQLSRSRMATASRDRLLVCVTL
jgi:hypothetical protein